MNKREGKANLHTAQDIISWQEPSYDKHIHISLLKSMCMFHNYNSVWSITITVLNITNCWGKCQSLREEANGQTSD